MIAKFALCVTMCTLGADPQSSAPPQNPPATQAAAPQDQFALLAIEQNIVDLTNAERARFGIPPLTVDRQLMDSARAHSTWMTLNQTMQHTRQPVAENIAMGQPNSQDVVRCWMNSSGHRANILNHGYRRIGVGAFRTPQGTIFWCQQFLW